MANIVEFLRTDTELLIELKVNFQMKMKLQDLKVI